MKFAINFALKESHPKYLLMRQAIGGGNGQRVISASDYTHANNIAAGMMSDGYVITGLFALPDCAQVTPWLQ